MQIPKLMNRWIGVRFDAAVRLAFCGVVVLGNVVASPSLRAQSSGASDKRIAILDTDQSNRGRQPRQKLLEYLRDEHGYTVINPGKFWFAAAQQGLAAEDFRDDQRRTQHTDEFDSILSELDLRAIFVIDVFADGVTVQLVVIGPQGREVADIRRKAPGTRFTAGETEELAEEALKRLKLLGGEPERKGAESSSQESGPSTSEASGTPASTESSDDSFGEGEGFGTEDMDFGDAEDTAEPEVEFEGQIEVEHHTYYRDYLDDVERQPTGRDSIEGQFGVTGSLGDASATASLLFRRGLVDPERNRFDLDEAYVDVDTVVELQAGRKKETWGRANIFSPTDILNRRDYRYPIEAEKRGAWLVSVARVFGETELRALLLPVPETHLIPVPETNQETGRLEYPSRWSVEIEPGGERQPDSIEFGPLQPPEPGLDHLQFGLRTSSSVGSVDFSAGYLYRYDLVPTLRTTVEVDRSGMRPQALATVRAEYPRVHIGTLGFETVVEGVRFFAESAAFVRDVDDPSRGRLNDTPYLTAVGGGDYTFPQFAGNHSISLALEGTKTVSLDGDELPSGALRLLRYPVETGVMGRLAYEIGTSYTLSASAIQGLDELQTYTRFESDYLLLDKVHLIAGADMFFGDESTVFGSFDRNSRFYLKFSSKF